MKELAYIAKVPTPLMDALITISSSLLNTNFQQIGRNLKNLGLEKFTKENIIDLYCHD